MRIRKRYAPSSSDLHLQQSAAPPPPSNHQPTHQPKQPSDQSMPIASSNNRWVFPEDQTEEKMKQKFENDETYWRVLEAKKGTNNDIRKIVNICDGEEGTNKILQPSSSSAQEESWCGGDYEVVPLKKRRGGFERNIPEDERMSTAEMKSKTNKKCVEITTKSVIDHDKKPVIIDERIGVEYSEKSMIKSKIRGNVIMEGSRCSRINGRGWRCRQPTLVGYSLCEHHLCKGRLRSAVVRRGKIVLHGGGGVEPPATSGGDSRAAAVAAPPPLVVVTKKRTKVGVVKARSMSSLLSQI